MMKRILLGILCFYRSWLSPGLHALWPSGCKFHPTCSQYAMDAIEIHGAGRGGWLALRRLLRCHPFSRGGFDPVPCLGSFARGLKPIDAFGPIGTTEVVPFYKAPQKLYNVQPEEVNPQPEMLRREPLP